MNAFAGKAFVLRVDEVAVQVEQSTLSSDLAFLAEHDVRPIVVATRIQPIAPMRLNTLPSVRVRKNRARDLRAEVLLSEEFDDRGVCNSAIHDLRGADSGAHS